MNRRAPEIRFYKFINDWEQHKMGNLSKIIDTKHATAPVVNFETQYRMIRTSFVRKGRLFPAKMDYVTYDTYEKWSERIHLEPNDVVFSREAPMGEAAVIPRDDNKYFLGQRMVGIRVSDDLDPFFLLATFLAPKFRKEIQIRNSESTTVANFGIPSIKDYEIDITNKEEQIKIGNFFEQLDNAIVLRQQLLNDYKQLKKAMLQKMFPQKGEIVPRVRVDGFSGDWNEHKFGDVFCRKSNKGRSDLPYVTVTERETFVRNDGAHGFGSNKSDESKLNAKIILNGEFLIDLSSYSRGIYMCGMDGITSSAYHVLELLSGDCGYWSEYFITHNFIESLKKLTPPGVRQGKMVEVSELLETYTLIPSISEQQKIGGFFKQLDKTIDLHQKKLETYQELKKAMLQKMFV